MFPILVFLFFRSNSFTEPNYNEVEFAIMEFDSTQMPVNTVFKYNLKGVKCDSATIRPFGKTHEEKFVVSTDDSIANYIYTRPWQYKPALTINGKVAKQITLNFAYDTWKAGLSNTRKVFYIKYFDDLEILRNGKLSFTKDFLIRKNFPLDNIEFSTYDLFKRFDNIFGDSLLFETKIKNNIIVREEGCGDVNIALCFQNGFILVPFSIEKSPYSSRLATIFNQNFSSENSSLSFLYLNLEEWNTIKFRTQGKHFDLYTNDSIVFSIDYNSNPGKLVGIMFDFKGLGEVDYVKFYNQNNKLIYNDSFD